MIFLVNYVNLKKELHLGVFCNIVSRNLARSLLRPRGEMDITFGFGPNVLGSNPGEGTG